MSLKRHAVSIGGITMGAGAPVVVQSMTDTDTADVIKTVEQIKLLVDAGSELVRLTVNTAEAAAAIAEIDAALKAQGYVVPLVGDFHYNGHQLLADYPDCAKTLAKYRINPGNVGFGAKKDLQFNAMIAAAIRYDKPVRIGVNWGSLDKRLAAKMMDYNAKLANPLAAGAVLREALISSAIQSADAAVAQGLSVNKIVISCKVSVVPDLIYIYQQLAQRCDYALHLGLTEAGMGRKGIVASTSALSVLLAQGIGDTIRVSITPEPGTLRDQEVFVAQQILQSLCLRNFAPEVTACPGCGRTTSTFFRELTQEVDAFLRHNLSRWRVQYSGVETLKVAVMGCVVNGPGESKHANIGISLPGTGESPVAPVFVDGKKVATLRGEHIAEEFKQMISDYVQSHYQPAASSLEV